MAVTTEQKVDFLLKKVGYSLSKTGSVTGTGAISGGTTKEPFAETLASPITVQSTSIWADSTYIPATPPGSDTGYVKGYRAAASGHRMTADSTVAGSRAFIAYTTYNNTSSGILGDWINTQFGADYIVKVYKGDPNSGGVQLSAAGSGSDDTWFFDYTSGILNFNGAALPSGVTDTNIYIVGYRYLGTRGVQPPGGIGTFHNLYVSGITTLVGNVFARSSVQIGIGLSVAGISTFTGNIDANGDLDVDGRSELDTVNIAETLNVVGISTFGANVKVTANGIDVTGLSTFRSGLNVIGLLQTNDDVNFTGATANATWDKSDNRLEFEDDASISIGDDDDLQLSHANDISLIRDTRAGVGGTLAIGADHLILRNKDGNETYLEATDNGSVKLYYDFGSRIETTGYGALITGGTSGIGTLSGPAAFHIDPAAVGDNTGLVIIKGNLQVDGTQTTVNSTTMTVDDKNIVLGQGAANDAAADGGGITLESGEGNKTWNWVDSANAWSSSEHIQVAAGKVFGFADDPNTYIDRPAADTIRFIGGGSERVRINASNTNITTSLSVTGLSTFTANIDANSNIDVAANLNVSGITTTVTFNIGTNGQSGLVGIATILDEDNMASDRVDAIATQQSIKKYVDDRTPGGPGGGSLEVSADSGSNQIINLNIDVLDLEGTANEIVTVTGSDKVIIGLPDNVTIGNDLTVTSNAGIGSLSVTGVSTFVGTMQLLDNSNQFKLGAGSGALSISGDTANGHGYIQHSGAGDFFIRSDTGFNFTRYSGGPHEKYATFNRDGTVDLYYDNGLRFQTSGIGVTITDQLDVSRIKASGITTTVTLNVGTAGQTLVGINTILDEDDMASNSATALATQQSIKKYVDDQVTAQDLDFVGDSGTGSVDLDGEQLDIEGTANEIVTSASGQKITIALPDDVTIGNDLTVTGDIASVTNLKVTGISTFGGNIDANAGLDVDGTSDLDQVNIAAGLNVTAGISTFAELIKATKSIQGSENLVVTGLSTFSSNVDVNASADISGNLIVGVAGTSIKTVVGAAVSVGIGSATPDYMLDVAGAINSETDVKIQGVSVQSQALNDAVAMAIALG